MSYLRGRNTACDPISYLLGFSLAVVCRTELKHQLDTAYCSLKKSSLPMGFPCFPNKKKKREELIQSCPPAPPNRTLPVLKMQLREMNLLL